MNAIGTFETLALAKVDQQRLERLANLAGRSPKALLKFVLRDGFDEVERDIRETLAAERDMSVHGAVAHAEVLRSARRIIESSRGRKLEKAS